MAMSLIQLKNISVAYDNKNFILQNFNLEVSKGEFISLLGPSGCGKTTTLRLIAGFNEAKEGHFLFNGTDYTKVPVHKRNFGFVFQNYALFPHLNIFDNIAFGLKQRSISESEIKKRVSEIMEIVNLTGFEKRYPAELSGGQRQRVAIARGLVIKPDLLLFDEPLSNLDANLRVHMRVEIRRIQKELGITTVYVSHDQEECFSISDKVAIMNKGVIEQLDKPSVIYKNPQTEFVARFIGFDNFLRFDVVERNEDMLSLKAPDGSVFTSNSTSNSVGEDKVSCAIRPDDIHIIQLGDRSAINTINGIIQVSTFLGQRYQYVVKTVLGNFIVNSPDEVPYEHGDNVTLSFPKEKLVPVK
jgi:putative spermidine/putrescine transport system ATP-binding protein